MQPPDEARFTDFPNVSAPHRDLMVDLVSTVETRLGSVLLPSNLPPEVQSYQNSNGTAHGSLHIRSGVPSSHIDFILGNWLHCELPSGGAWNITTLSAYLNPSTDATNFVVELIQSSPTSMVLILDLPPRKDLILNSYYLKTFYEDTQLDQYRQRLEKLPEVQMEEIVRDHLSPTVKEVLGIWLDLCACGNREVGESDRAYLENRDKVTNSKTIEIDLVSNLPRLFGQGVADRVLETVREVF